MASASVCDGITVLDFSQGMAGSMATMVLGDNGAEVIKVEPPGGDPGRSIPAWLMWNRGKKSIVLDPNTEGDREVIYGLARHADVLVESFRPGSADRMGIGFDRLASVNPQLVYCSITAMGSKGAYKNMAPYDAVVEAMALPEYPEPDIQELGPDDVFSILLDPSRTFADFGDIQFTPIQQTVAEAIAYYQKHGTLGEYTHLRYEEKK